MAIFGFIVMICIALLLTAATGFLLLHGGTDMGPAPLRVWLIGVPLIAMVWWLIFVWFRFEL